MRAVRKQLIAVSGALLVLGAAGAATASTLARSASSSGRSNLARVADRVCPGYDTHAMISTNNGAGTTLVPSGAQQVLLCRYSGVGPDRAAAMRLLAHRLVADRATVARLAGELNELKPLTATVACPADSGAAIVAIFRYLPLAKADDPVTVGLSGCLLVTNGHVRRAALSSPGPRLVSQLQSLLSSRAGTGTLIGAIRFVGGPSVLHRPPIAGEVSVFTAAGRLIAREKVRAGQWFHFRLAPGRYELSDGASLHPRLDCSPTTAVVRASQTTRADVDTGCLVP